MIYYLYVKTHNKTGLKYLGHTKSKDPFAYKGSGTKWTSHIKKHGYDVKTEILHECNSLDEIGKLGMYYSTLWNVVDNAEWANLKPETGEGGWYLYGDRNPQKRQEVRDKVSKSLKEYYKLNPRSEKRKAEHSEWNAKYWTSENKELHREVSRKNAIKGGEAVKGKVAVRDKTGKSLMIPKDVYYSRDKTIPECDQEYVSTASKEGRRRLQVSLRTVVANG